MYHSLESLLDDMLVAIPCLVDHCFIIQGLFVGRISNRVNPYPLNKTDHLVNAYSQDKALFDPLHTLIPGFCVATLTVES